ncbi:hypothetical protein A2U01_0110744, partial [Trifolium medium]|nr:hypothetical protein [Trifolium medium]
EETEKIKGICQKAELRVAQQSCAWRNSSGILDAENLSHARGAAGACRAARGAADAARGAADMTRWKV